MKRFKYLILYQRCHTWSLTLKMIHIIKNILYYYRYLLLKYEGKPFPQMWKQSIACLIRSSC